MNLQSKGRLIGHLAALFTVLIWGTTFISTKFLLIGLTPAEILFFRFLLGYLILWAAAPKRLKLKDKKHEWYFIGAGFFGITCYYLMENVALTYTFASNAGVIIAMTPFFTGILTAVFVKEETLKGSFFVGFLVAMAGIILISFNGAKNFHLNPLGDLLEVGAALTWSTYSIFSKKLGRYGYPVIQVTRRTFFYGLVFMIPAMFFMDFDPSITVFRDPVLLVNLLYLAIFASALCFATWNFAVRRLGAIGTSVYIYLVPVVTVLASALILKEQVNLVSVCGTALALAGLILSQRPSGGKTKLQE